MVKPYDIGSNSVTSSGSGKKRNTKSIKSTCKTIIRTPKFEGRCEEINGHIYDLSNSRQSDIFVNTTKETGETVLIHFWSMH